jgi:hypothetical protein
MNQIPEKLYLGQNVMKEQRSAYKSYTEKIILNLLLNYPEQNISNQFKPKKLLYIKSLGTDKTGVTPMRSDGQITADTKQKSNIPQQCQSVFTVESQDNIPDCTKTHTIKTALPISLPGVKETPT